MWGSGAHIHYMGTVASGQHWIKVVCVTLRRKIAFRMPRSKPLRDRSIRTASGKGYVKRKSSFFPKGVYSKFPKKEEDVTTSDISTPGLTGNERNSVKIIKRHHQEYFEDLWLNLPLRRTTDKSFGSL